MHILFFSDNFPPEVNAPASRTHEHCRAWVNAGHRVTVVTGVPNFPTGKVFPGYRNRLSQWELIDGIHVLRVVTYVTANEGFYKRSFDYASYMVAATIAAPFIRDVDLVVATSPQFFAAFAGYFASRLLRVPFVFELRDLWPESIRAVGALKNGQTLRALERLELFLYERAAAIVSVTKSFRENLAGRGVDPRKIHVVTNGADLDRFVPSAKDASLLTELDLTGKFVAGYVGTMGMAHGLDTLIATASRLKPVKEGGDTVLLLLGDGVARRDLEAASARLDTVRFINSVSKDQVARYWSLLDASIIHLKRDPLFQTVIP
jgi:glycosyltransferase involved in cell wall biosynthesis